MTFYELLKNALLKYGEKEALIFIREGRPESRLTYADIDADSSRMANRLADRGIKKGDRVILFMPKSVFFVISHLAIQKIGAIGVPLNPGFKPSEMAYFIEDAEPKLIIAGAEQLEILNSIKSSVNIIHVDTGIPYERIDLLNRYHERIDEPEISEDDPALLIYTSGTTGRPKGAILTQRNLAHDAEKILRIWEINQNDVLCHALPLFHVHGLCFALHTAIISGSKVIMLDRFSAPEVMDILKRKEEDFRCSVFMAVPAMYNKLLDFVGQKKIDLSHMRLLTSGSAPLSPKDFFRIKEVFGKEVVEREGMSETGMNFSNPLHGKKKPGSIGVPLPELEVRIVDPESFRDVRKGDVGEIWLKGPGVTPGYWRKPDETEKAFHDGWFRTGDLGRVDEDGYYYLTDRLKHIIISGGENISPKEIENVISRLDGVIEACVVGIPDPKWGEKVVAAVVKERDADLDEDKIKDFCKMHLHDWKCPKDIRFIDELPRNTMGKVLKDRVKEFF